MTNASFNLVDQPWLPCVRGDGSQVELGLRDLFAQAHELRELSSESPMVVVALHRLLLAILHRNFGPADAEQWASLWNAGSFNQSTLGAYLDQWRHRFDLFDPARPFMQAADARLKPKAINHLIHEVASGNNGTLFNHNLDEEPLSILPAQAARILITAQAFGLAGLSGLDEKFTYAPCLGGANFILVGSSLFETLLLNLIPYTAVDPLPRQPGDAPSWEMDDPFSPLRSQPLGYLDYLTWLNRRVVLQPVAADDGIVVREITLTPGLRIQGSVLNPLMHYTVDDKKGMLPLRFRESKALWRDSAALFQIQSTGYRPPQAVAWVSELIDDYGYLEGRDRRYRIMALGLANDQAKIEFLRAEHLPLHPAYLTDRSLVDDLSRMLESSENAARQLWGAARTLATYIVSPNFGAPDARKPMREDLDQVMEPWGVERIFWSQMETLFVTVFDELPRNRDVAMETWSRAVQRIAWEALTSAADSLAPTPRNLKAAVEARSQLAAGLRRVFPNQPS